MPLYNDHICYFEISKELKDKTECWYECSEIVSYILCGSVNWYNFRKNSLVKVYQKL